jgi:membrane protein
MRKNLKNGVDPLSSMQSVQAKFTHFMKFIRVDIWRIRLDGLPRPKSSFIHGFRIILLAFAKYAKDQCLLRASSLTYYALLSVVPMAAMAFGIAKGFGFEKLLKKEFMEKFPGQDSLSEHIIRFSDSLLANTHSGMIAGIGLIVLFWTIAKVLMNIENSFNVIWEIKKSRSFGRKFTQYLTIIILCPVLIFLASSVNVFIRSQVVSITGKIPLPGMINEQIFSLLKLIPFGLIWLLFTITYYTLPVARIKLGSALIAGIIAGTIFQLVQGTYIHFQIGVAQYNAIYGSFAALPLFIIWLHFSWMIVLFGAELSYAIQHGAAYEFEPDRLCLSLFQQKLFSLQIAWLLTKRFANGETPYTHEEIAKSLKLPIRLVRQMTGKLIESGLFATTLLHEGGKSGIQPARDIRHFTVQFIIEALEHNGTVFLPEGQTDELNTLAQTLKTFGQAMEQSAANKHLINI